MAPPWHPGYLACLHSLTRILAEHWTILSQDGSLVKIVTICFSSSPLFCERLQILWKASIGQFILSLSGYSEYGAFHFALPFKVQLQALVSLILQSTLAHLQ